MELFSNMKENLGEKRAVFVPTLQQTCNTCRLRCVIDKARCANSSTKCKGGHPLVYPNPCEYYSKSFATKVDELLGLT